MNSKFDALTLRKERFWSYVENVGSSGCWTWAKCRTAAGYGRFGVGLIKGKSTYMLAHRSAYYLAKGELLLDELVMHSCDNPPCCNPSHLEAGSQKKNQQDKAKRGRSNRGIDRHNAKLSEDQVDEIRNISYFERRPYTDIAKDYGTTPSNVRSIVIRKTWKHVR